MYIKAGKEHAAPVHANKILCKLVKLDTFSFLKIILLIWIFRQCQSKIIRPNIIVDVVRLRIFLDSTLTEQSLIV